MESRKLKATFREGRWTNGFDGTSDRKENGVGVPVRVRRPVVSSSEGGSVLVGVVETVGYTHRLPTRTHNEQAGRSFEHRRLSRLQGVQDNSACRSSVDDIIPL